MKSISEKVAKSTGRFTGKVTNAIKAAPKATTSKTKAIKNAFVDGVESTKPAKKSRERSENFDKIFE
jgi:ribosomal protein L14E/L6E/L27E